MEFKSQICTTREQSERLLSLGLKRETADCVLIPSCNWDGTDVIRVGALHLECKLSIPAWSMHRLIELLSTSMFPYRVIDNDFPLYDSLIARIEWQIEEGYFPKEYLYEKEKETF